MKLNRFLTTLLIFFSLAVSAFSQTNSPLMKSFHAISSHDLLRYADDPILDIDNNLAERTLRMVVIGRKNYMFAGSEAGAKRAAIIYSLVASCKLNDIDPFAYFDNVLRKVSTHPASRIDELLPNNWGKSNSQEKASLGVEEDTSQAA